LKHGCVRMVVDDSPAGWKTASQYLRLWSSPAPPAVPRGFYRGVLRLRWRAAVVYVVLRSSPLLSFSNLGFTTLYGGNLPFGSPVLRAADVFIIGGKTGQSCNASCAQVSANISVQGGAEVTGRQLRCHAADLMYLNSCAAIRDATLNGACAECATSEGAFQPATITVADSSDAPPAGTCTWNANLAVPPTCEAAHPGVSRLCTCRLCDGGAQKIVESRAGQQSPRIPAHLEPADLVSDSIASNRCGGAFGNRLSASCRVENPGAVRNT